MMNKVGNEPSRTSERDERAEHDEQLSEQTPLFARERRAKNFQGCSSVSTSLPMSARLHERRAENYPARLSSARGSARGLVGPWATYDAFSLIERCMSFSFAN